MKTINKFNHKITLGFGSASGHPGSKGMQVSLVRLWMKLDKNNWFQPNIHSIVEITNILNSADDEEELLELIKYMQE